MGTRVFLSDRRRTSYFENFEMPGRHFPIVNQQSGLALEASNRGNAVVELKEYVDGRDCQLWFKVDETIRSKAYPTKVLTLDENWKLRGWGKVYLQTRHHMLDTQKWKIVEGPYSNQILSVVRNTQRLDSLKVIQIGQFRFGTDLLCCKMQSGGQPNWSFQDNVTPAPAPAHAPAPAPAPEGNTILAGHTPRVRHIEQQKLNRSSVLRSLPPDIHQDLECVVCLEMMGRKGAQIFQCTQSHLICPSCRFRLDKCPICREPYKQLIRNRMAETIGRFFVTPCKAPFPTISSGPPANSVTPPTHPTSYGGASR